MAYMYADGSPTPRSYPSGVEKYCPPHHPNCPIHWKNKDEDEGDVDNPRENGQFKGLSSGILIALNIHILYSDLY